MLKNPPKYHAKILLFGEYILMSGSRALTLPFPGFGGCFEFDKTKSPDHIRSNSSLKEFHNYLAEKKKAFPGNLEIDLDRFLMDINKGLFLDSDIPQGYGVGSSGLLVASVYNRYALHPLNPENEDKLLILKNYFTFMESFFHGRSSGLDPLSCYAGKPLLVSSPEKIKIVEFPERNHEKNFTIFLVDTETTSKTEGLVNTYLKNLKNNSYKQVIEDTLIPRSNQCIDSVLQGKTADFFNEVQSLSELQLELFKEMIPLNFRTLWKFGTETRDFSLKLCGSGGGGFLLGFTTVLQKTENYFTENGKKLIPVFKNS